MPCHIIEPETKKKWKKGKWKTLSPDKVKFILLMRERRIRRTQFLAWRADVNPIYPSDDDDLANKENRD